MVSSVKRVSIMSKIDKMAVSSDFFFKFIGSADKEGNSLCECLKCARRQNKPLSYHDTWRQNLKKHIAVRRRHTLTLHAAVLS